MGLRWDGDGYQKVVKKGELGVRNQPPYSNIKTARPLISSSLP